MVQSYVEKLSRLTLIDRLTQIKTRSCFRISWMLALHEQKGAKNGFSSFEATFFYELWLSGETYIAIIEDPNSPFNVSKLPKPVDFEGFLS